MAGTDRQDSRGGRLNSAPASVRQSAPRVLLAGASGLIGSQALGELRRIQPQARVEVLLRRTGFDDDAGIQAFRAEPLSEAVALWRQSGRGCDALLCAIGTTRRAAGSIEAFAAIDRDLVIEIAAAARAAGARQAIVVSSIGASADSRNDYLRVKGEMEDSLARLGFERCDLLQPSLLLGARGGSARPAERLGQWLAPFFNPLLAGALADYRAIESLEVARAAVALIGRAPAGVFRHRFAAFRQLATQLA
jgi:uncharacterized protein YbjT (DUF2867 family)